MTPTKNDRIKAIADEARESVMESFQAICEKKILDFRDGEALPEKKKKLIDSGKAIDPRPLRLSAISGKGGWSEDPKVAASRAKFDNVALLDHLISVARGAMVFEGIRASSRLAGMSAIEAAIQERGLNVDDDKDLRDYFSAQIGYAFALGFLHDANKIAGCSSNRSMGAKEIEEIGVSLGIDQFLGEVSDSNRGREIAKCLGRQDGLWSPEAFAYEIALVESNSSYAHALPKNLIPNVSAAMSARLADRMDGKFLLGGAKAALSEMGAALPNFGGDLLIGLGEWEEKTVREPQFPMLLEELRQALSQECWGKAKCWPLICSTRDGELTALLPKNGAKDIWMAAVENVIANRLPFRPSVLVNNRLALSISGGAYDLRDVQAALRNGGDPILSIKKELKEFLSRPFGENDVAWIHAWDGLAANAAGMANPEDSRDQMLKDMGAQAASESLSGKSFWLQKRGAEAKGRGGEALACVAILACEIEKIKGDSFLETEERLLKWEKEALTQGISLTVPMRMILDMKPGTLSAATFAVLDVLLSDEMHDGSADSEKKWIHMMSVAEGMLKSFSHRQPMAHANSMAAQELRRRFLGEDISSALPKTGGYRCLFTDEIVGEDRKLEQEFLLPHIKSSAFSGRSGRPDHLMSAPAKGVTHVSVIGQLEGALAAKNMGLSERDQVGVRVFSPNGSGLFGTIERKGARGQIHGYSSFDLLRESKSDGNLVFSGMESYFQPVRVGKAEAFPGKLFSKKDASESQAGFLLRWLKAAERYGKPIHLFRGLPEHRKEFFFCDCIPKELEGLLGGSGLRLEQLGGAIAKLEAVLAVVETLGSDEAKRLLGAKGSRQAQLMAACWRLGKSDENVAHLSLAQKMLSKWVDDIEKGGSAMDKSLALGLGDFAKACSRAQMTSGWKLSNNEAGMCWALAWEGLALAKSMGVSGESFREGDGLAIIAGHMQKSLERKGTMKSGEQAAASLEEGAKAFVGMYLGPLKGRTPPGKELGILRDAYMWTFEREIRSRIMEAKAKKAELQESAEE